MTGWDAILTGAAILGLGLAVGLLTFLPLFVAGVLTERRSQRRNREMTR